MADVQGLAVHLLVHWRVLKGGGLCIVYGLENTVSTWPLCTHFPSPSLANSIYRLFETGMHWPTSQPVLEKAFVPSIFFGIHLMEGNQVSLQIDEKCRCTQVFSLLVKPCLSYHFLLAQLVSNSAGPMGSNYKTRNHCQHLTKWRGGNKWWWYPQMYRKRKGTSPKFFPSMEKRVGRNSFHNMNSAFSQKASSSSLPVLFQYLLTVKNWETSLV